MYKRGVGCLIACVSTLDIAPRKSALVVDDDAAARKLLKRTLQRLGFRVVEAGTGRAAVAFLNTNNPDLVCLEMVLPEMSGFEIIAFIRRHPRFAATPVVVVSHRNLPEDQAQAREQGAAAYLTKPFKPEELERCVRSLVAANSDPGSARSA